MSIMSTASASAASWVPTGRPFLATDLAAAPDDGNRYELVDGMLVVSPAPKPRHQRALRNLTVLMTEGCPAEHEVFFAPLDVVLADDTVVQPDLLVTRRADLTEANLPTAPLLAVEILSQSTRGFDLLTKRDRLRRAGCPSYWVVDPDVPRLIAWELDAAGEYQQVVDVAGDQAWTAERPFPVTIVPGRLLA